MNTRTAILNDATTLINGDREKDYGTDSCHMMSLLKIARLRNGPHRDSSVDGAGYMALGAEMSEGE